MLFISSILFYFSLGLASENTSHYDYDKNSIRVEWTGYKFTEKKGVKGTLKNVVVQVKGNSPTVEKLLAATSFEVDSLSVDSGDPARDTNLRDSFFKLMASPKITGKIKSYSKGKAQVELTLNGVTKVVPFEVKIEGAKILATSDIDILDFSMASSLKKISETCHELHKGTDGVSKTWSQVGLAISAETVFERLSPNSKK